MLRHIYLFSIVPVSERRFESTVSFVYNRRPQSSLILDGLPNPNGGQEKPLNQGARMSQDGVFIVQASVQTSYFVGPGFSQSQMDVDIKKRDVARAAQNAAGATYASVASELLPR